MIGNMKLVLALIIVLYLFSISIFFALTHASRENLGTLDSAEQDNEAQDVANQIEAPKSTILESKRKENTKTKTMLAVKETTKKSKGNENVSGNRSKISRQNNPFYLLGAYPEITSKYQPLRFKIMTLNIIKDNDYCDNVDFQNLQDQSRLISSMNFWTDFPKNQLPSIVMSKLGDSIFGRPTSKQYGINGKSYHLPHNITNFFSEFNNMHYYHKIGTHFACATQMYGRIPGQEVVATKDALADRIHSYAKQYKDKPQCFDQKSLFPYTYRLYNKEECTQFFKIINSVTYKASLKDEPVQYLVKVGRDSHKSKGVFLLDPKETKSLNKQYDSGKKCGKESKSLLAQAYVSNPLLLDLGNKFDFRVYMLIASTNPLIVYYHDGFIKTSLLPYQKSSSQKGAHITNTFLANLQIEELKKRNETLNGMTPEQLKNYILWNFDRLQAYLLEAGKISDPNWLDNYLRPAFYKAYIHLMRMTKDSFWKQSNVYALHGVDFMLDDKMNLWFIESNTSPLLSGTSISYIYKQVLNSMFEIQYAYFRSRMSRLLSIVNEFQKENSIGKVKDIKKWQKKYQDAVKNKLEPEFQISKNNTFRLVIDENLPGSKAYSDYVPSECLKN